ncbi:SAM-dependent methyltransferase [Sulfurospirillum arcachonense]|uniref:SAM-dependent methyltransferase n=1 Tax=Sulfurospirillum arcachonense TaxID=57666 RepID=UPI0004682078|nr:class I SAM-dependent methyltransferase [Sulfurospirillum arcachonense]
MQELWNEKFSRDGFLYGTEVNSFIKENEDIFKKDFKVLCLGEGEGRNAIFLAKKGLHVEALDASDIGLKKLQKRSLEENVAITIRHTLLENWQPHGKYDVILSTYTHVDQNEQTDMFVKVLDGLKSGGFFIAEFFSIDQLHFESGGPKDIELLYDLGNLYQLFFNLPCTIYKLSQEIIELKEGKGHNGEASVIRIILKRN